MILTGQMIDEAVRRGEIRLHPYTPAQLNPNSYNYRLGPELKRAEVGEDGQTRFVPVPLSEEGTTLEAFTLYLGHTAEEIGSSEYAMSLIGRSSMGRLGLFLQVSANLGHRGSAHRWTLEIYSCLPLVVFPNMKIGQVSFWKTVGTYQEFDRRYALLNEPHESMGIPRSPQIQSVSSPPLPAVRTVSSPSLPAVRAPAPPPARSAALPPLPAPRKKVAT